MARRIEDSLKCFPWLDLAISALKANELEGVKFNNNNKFIQYYHFVQVLPIKITIINS